MCGIVGLIARTSVSPDIIHAATDAIRHRGPNDQGHWLSDDRRVVLGHRRLSIIDLSAAGHQPMTSADGRYVAVYNGEIYNHVDIRRELEAAGLAPQWRGRSDTEVLLAAIIAWGVRGALERAAGMFALALWDIAKRRLILARDRFGEKPLYYGWCRAGFAFASELKAIRAFPGFDNAIDEDAVRLLLGYGCVPAPLSIYRGLFKLEPGTILSLPADIYRHPGDAALSRAAVPGVRWERYYDYADVVLNGAAEPFPDHTTALDALRQALTRSVGRQMVADVPVGTFLSGGIDSSLITALATRTSGQVRSFSIGFADEGYDEAPFARAIARQLGTDHHELYVTASQVQTIIPMLPTIYDEPFADSSQLPTYLVNKFARSEVTVALSGDGGDELFGGYNRHIEFPRLWRRFSGIPAALRGPALGLAARIPAGAWNRASALMTGRARPSFFGHKVKRALATAGRSKSFPDLASGFLDTWNGEKPPSRGSVTSYEAAQRALYDRLAGLPLGNQLMAADALAYLPDTILTKVDRAAMAVSLEGRIPFLDTAVAGVASRIPAHLNFVGGQGKQMLRDLLYTMVPKTLLDRPKAGFAMPVGPWLRGELRDWAEDLLAPSSLEMTGMLDATAIRRRWDDHISGRRDHSESLWYVLMLQGWVRDQAG